MCGHRPGHHDHTLPALPATGKGDPPAYLPGSTAGATWLLEDLFCRTPKDAVKQCEAMKCPRPCVAAGASGHTLLKAAAKDLNGHSFARAASGELSCAAHLFSHSSH